MRVPLQNPKLRKLTGSAGTVRKIRAPVVGYAEVRVPLTMRGDLGARPSAGAIAKMLSPTALAWPARLTTTKRPIGIAATSFLNHDRPTGLRAHAALSKDIPSIMRITGP
jgi:hypothetical protein